MNKIDLVITAKEEELQRMQQEMAIALGFDPDYDYAGLLSPVIGKLEQEIDKLRSMAGHTESADADLFVRYIRQLLSGECKCLEIHVRPANTPVISSLPLLLIQKQRSSKTLVCRLNVDEIIAGYLPTHYAEELQRIGWKSDKAKRNFKLKTLIKTTDDLNAFQMLIAQTLIEPFYFLIHEAGSDQFLVTRPAPQG